MEVRQSINSEYARTLDTTGLRKEFLVEKVFEPDALALTYSHIDRIIVGGAFPQTRAVEVPNSLGKSIGVSYLLERRELGAINIGGDGWVEADGKRFAVFPRPDVGEERKGSVHVTVLLNFFDELRRKVPASK